MPEIRILSTLGIMAAFQQLAERYEAANEVRVAAQFAPTNGVLERIRSGETADATIIIASGIEELIREGVLAPGTRTDLAVSTVGLAVRAGAPKPEIGSVEAFKSALLAAKSIAYSRIGASGVFFSGLIERLGIAEAINAKATIIPSGFTAEVVARGEAELAVQQVSELMAITGVDIVGPFPREIGSFSTFAAALFRAAEEPEAAAGLIRYLASVEAVEIIRSTGLEPIAAG